MPAAFEDFFELAESRLRQADAAICGGARVSGATCAALSTVTGALVVLATRYGTTPAQTPVTVWQPAFVDHLSDADRRLRYHGGSPGASTATDELIADAGRFLTVAQDLLATHLTTPDPPRPFARTPQGAELLGIPVRDHLLRRAAELAEHLAELVRAVATFDQLSGERPQSIDAYRPRERDLIAAARELAHAAAQCPEPSATRLDLSPAPVMAASDYPQPDEAPALAAEQIRTGLERLATAAYRAANRLHTGEHPPTHTASGMRVAATSLAVAYALAADLVIRLAPRLSAGPELNPVEAADRLRAAGAMWAKLRRPWERIASIPDSGPRSALAVQADSVVIRLGRLLYAGPAWTPRTGPGRPRVLDELIAPDALDAICVMLGTLPRAAATIAANHARLISDAVLDLRSADQAHRPEDEARSFYPLQPAQRANLTAGYRDAVSMSDAAAATVVPLTRGYQALKAAELIRPSNSAHNPDPDRIHRIHQDSRQQATVRRPSLSPEQ